MSDKKINPYLIQRCLFEYTNKRRNTIGIDNILSFCYMGSSEYEWGALPDSLKEIRLRLEKYVYFDITIRDRVITVFCLDDHKEFMLDILTKLGRDEFQLKGRSFFDIFLLDDLDEGKQHSYFNTDCWWDIENHYLFWRKDEEFEKQFKVLIQPNKK